MKRQLANDTGEDSSPSTVKNEPSTPPSSTSPSPKKARKSPTTPVKSSPVKTATPKGSPGSMAHSAKGRYMEMLFEAGIKAINKKDVQGETGLTPAQQQELLRKDKGALRRAVGAFVSGL